VGVRVCVCLKLLHTFHNPSILCDTFWYFPVLYFMETELTQWARAFPYPRLNNSGWVDVVGSVLEDALSLGIIRQVPEAIFLCSCLERTCLMTRSLEAKQGQKLLPLYLTCELSSSPLPGVESLTQWPILPPCRCCTCSPLWEGSHSGAPMMERSGITTAPQNKLQLFFLVLCLIT
jgi:hypothetical protein